jgi:hypothetical protein
MKTKFVQTRINKILYKKLLEHAKNEERSISSLIRIIIKNYLIPKNKKQNPE